MSNSTLKFTLFLIATNFAVSWTFDSHHRIEERSPSPQSVIFHTISQIEFLKTGNAPVPISGWLRVLNRIATAMCTLYYVLARCIFFVKFSDIKSLEYLFERKGQCCIWTNSFFIIESRNNHNSKKKKYAQTEIKTLTVRKETKGYGRNDCAFHTRSEFKIGVRGTVNLKRLSVGLVTW